MSDEVIPILIGDIGGTNSRLGIVTIGTPSLQLIEIDKENFKTFARESFSQILKNYLEKFKNTKNFPKLAILGIPGGIVNNRVIVSNRLSELNGKLGSEMAKEIGVEHVIYINDFNINGYAIQSSCLKENIDYFQLNPDVKPEPNGTKALIGAGSGLGMGFMTKTPFDKYYSVHSSEGGFNDFSPLNELQEKYKKYLNRKFPRPTVENACCGDSIFEMYNFFSEIEGVGGDTELKEEVKNVGQNQDKKIILNEKIIKHGTSGKCGICKKVVDFFLEIYASISGNFATTILPFGGIFLTGGVTLALSDYIRKNNIFLNNFVHKGSVEVLLKRIPIYIILNPNFGVHGVTVFAKKVIEEGKIDLISQ